MKTVKLIGGIIFYILFYYFYRSKRSEIIEGIYSYTPRLYSSTNLKIFTVTLSKDYEIRVNSKEAVIQSNNQYKYEPRIFNIDDANELYSYGLLCTPNSFGFNKEDTKKLFPTVIYPKCSDLTGLIESSLHIDREEDKIYMNCDNNSGDFIYGPYGNNKLPTYNDFVFLKHPDNGPIIHENVEFGLGTCKRDKNIFHNAVLQPKFNKTAYSNALKKIKTEKPTIIYFLTIDSFSRAHFFRKLPKTVEYFNNLHKKHPDLAIYDFKLHSTFGRSSVENQISILGKYENFVYEFKGNQDIDKLGKDAIWNILREEGYISLMGFDDCDFSFPESLGRNPNVDYSVRQFYCYAKNKLSIETAG